MHDSQHHEGHHAQCSDNKEDSRRALLWAKGDHERRGQTQDGRVHNIEVLVIIEYATHDSANKTPHSQSDTVLKVSVLKVVVIHIYPGKTYKNIV